MMEITVVNRKTRINNQKPELFKKVCLLVISPFILLALGIGFLVYMDVKIQKISLKSISNPVHNPLMGLAPWAWIKVSEQPHTLVYADLSWRNFEPQPGVYDYSRFEKDNQLDRWKAEGKRVVFRFYCDNPGKNDHMDIPNWLFDATGGSGDLYANKYGKGFSPDYSNPIFLQNHKKVIKALGDKYGRDDFFAFIELGSLGHWGEWHVDTNAGIRKFPTTEIRDQYVKHYIEAFPNTHLLMRRPFSITQRDNLGLYNDMTGDLKATVQWLGWIRDGGEYNVTGEKNALQSMPDGWKTAPIGGEQSPSTLDDYMYGSHLYQSIQMVKDSHMSFLGPGGPYDIKKGGVLQSGIDQVLAELGYRIYLKEIQMPQRIILKNFLDIKIIFGNDGIAPIYYNWPTEFYVFDKNDKIRITIRPEMDIRKIIPGEEYPISISIPLNQLENNQYRIGMAILDPLTGKPGVKLAMESGRQDLIQDLGSFELFRIGYWKWN